MTTIAINASTSAVSEYEDFEFDGFVQVGAALFGIDAAGLHALGGDDDDGEPIIGTLTTDRFAPAGARVTRIDRLTLGYLGTRVVVHAIHGQAGEGGEAHFELPAQTAEFPRPGVVKVAKGIASRYWSFRVRLTAPATLDALTLTPLPTTRTR